MKKYLMILALISLCMFCSCFLAQADSTEDKIIFISNQGQGFFIYTMDSDSKNVSTFNVDEKYNFNWVFVSKNKNRIVLNDFKAGIYVSDMEGNNISLVIPKEDNSNYSYPKLSPDGSQIVFTKSSLEDRVQNKWIRNIWYYKLGSKSAVKLTDGKFNIYPAFSPDGKKVVYVSKVGDRSQLFIMDLETKKTKKITSLEEDYLEHPSFSPNGKKILFDTVYGLYIINTDGTGLFEIVCNPAYFFTNPSWSPDGKKIAYLMARNQEGANFDIYTTDPYGEQDPINLSNTPGGNITYGCPQWY